jgi:hypothetical protein
MGGFNGVDKKIGFLVLFYFIFYFLSLERDRACEGQRLHGEMLVFRLAAPMSIERGFSNLGTWYTARTPDE